MVAVSNTFCDILQGSVAECTGTQRRFLPRDALVHSAVLRLHVVRLSVCPSVRPSVTLVDKNPSEHKPMKNLGETGAWAYTDRDCPNFLSTPYYLKILTSNLAGIFTGPIRTKAL